MKKLFKSPILLYFLLLGGVTFLFFLFEEWFIFRDTISWRVDTCISLLNGVIGTIVIHYLRKRLDRKKNQNTKSPI